MKTFADIKRARIEWLWGGRIPLRKLTILDGDPGQGKSLITVDLAARLSKGDRMPDGCPGKRGGTVFVAVEDDMADTILPRLEDSGADLTAITDLRLQEADARSSFTIQSLSRLEEAVVAVAAKLVVIDPIGAFLPKDCDANDDAAVRIALRPLIEFAAKHNLAIVLIRHLNKDDKKPQMYRGSGSIGFVAVCRSALMVKPHPELSRHFLLETYKLNIAQKPRPLAYSILERNGSPYVAWQGEYDAPESPKSPLSKKLLAAVQFLKGALAFGKRPSEGLEQSAIEAEISTSTYRRAREELGILSHQEGGIWYSSLPPQIPRCSDIQLTPEDLEKLPHA